MKTISTRLMASLLLAAVALVLPQQASAQDDVEMTGYANIYVRVKAAPQGGGQVFPFYQESTVKAWRDSWDFKQPVAVGSILNSPFTILYLTVQLCLWRLVSRRWRRRLRHGQGRAHGRDARIHQHGSPR